MNVLQFLLKHRRWDGVSLRTSIAQPEYLEVFKRTKRARIESNTLQTTGVDRLICEAVLSIAPKEVMEWDRPKIMLNRNVTCRRHRDANEGYSFLLWLGDFEGGALHFDDGTCLRDKGGLAQDKR